TGRALAVTTLLLDILKGVFAVWLMDHVSGGSAAWTGAAALVVMFGHAFPVFLKFRGGKAVASFIGAFLYLTPVPLLCVLLLFTIVVAATRYISLGSILAAGLFPFGVWLILHPDWSVVAAAFIAGTFIIWRHRANIVRIRAGTEHVFRFGSPKPAGARR
ncbi:MAG TPA: glycerol-3-phosphate acyltransferase, partial [Bryobacteraceae bacterium]|nr:glycerol-3-phosphate acyltransferase [Bryobacteraceae bacterium]